MTEILFLGKLSLTVYRDFFKLITLCSCDLLISVSDQYNFIIIILSLVHVQLQVHATTQNGSNRLC